MDERRLAAATGERGEEAAARLLRRMGWKVLDRNWRSASLELDLVCRDGDTIVFVEVKTRAGDGLTSPVEALTAIKRKRLVRAARAWLAAHEAWEDPCRFDLVAVTVREGQYQTELYRHVIELGEDAGRSAGRGHAPWQPW